MGDPCLGSFNLAVFLRGRVSGRLAFLFLFDFFFCHERTLGLDFFRVIILKDLNTLIPANSTLHLLGAYSINDEGEIAGQACVLPACTEMHAYRLTPKW